MHHLNENAGTLTLMGSGEMSPGMAETHRRVMRQIEGEVRPAFIDTPAGFELNVSNIREKAVEYFRDNFSLDLAIASFPSAAQATPLTTEAALRTLRNANYIFSGPGSPTYAVRNWRGTPIFETMAGKLASGAHLVMASAATLALGRYTVPVYEIYKVGEEPHWVDGIDLIGRYGLNLAIVPHWNNNSGGGHDTTRCFIGASRFEQLRAVLPTTATVLGIDEYTACVLAPHEQTCRVFGAGTVTVQHGENVRVFGAGEQFGFDLLRHPQSSSDTPAASKLAALTNDTLAAFRQALRDHRPASAVGYAHSLIELMRVTRETGTDADQLAYVQLMVREMLAVLAIWLEEHQGSAHHAPIEDPLLGRLADLLIAQRAALRAGKQYAQADQLRADLLAAGIELKDTPQGTVWLRTTTALEQKNS
jgi:hypothetical protein